MHTGRAWGGRGPTTCRLRHCPRLAPAGGVLGAGRVWASLGGPCHQPGIPEMKLKAFKARSPAGDRGQLWLHTTALVIFKRLMMQFKISLECSPPHTLSSRPCCKGHWGCLETPNGAEKRRNGAVGFKGRG